MNQFDELDDELDFESIQKIFAQRDEERKKIEESTTIKAESLKPLSAPTKINLKSEPRYNNMHAKNINITSKGREKSQRNKLVLVVGVALAISIGSIAYTVNQSSQMPKGESDVVYMDEIYQSSVEDIIDPQKCDFSNLTIILRESTSNVGQVTKVAEQELIGFGVNTKCITNDEDIIDVISGIKEDDLNREIVVINIDGVANKGLNDTVIMTNYSNNSKSADVLAMAIYNANKDIYGISSDIRCGKKDATKGTRTKTSVEMMLEKAGYIDIACLTVAINDTYLEEININNLATSIAEGVVRFSSLAPEERYADLIRRIEVGDTISELALENGVSESYLRSTNATTLTNSNGNLQYNSAIIVSAIPKALTGQASVKNDMITTNPNDIKTIISYHIVEENDTISELAERLNVKISNFVVPSGDLDVIKVGEKIAYEKMEGPILVVKSSEKSK